MNYLSRKIALLNESRIKKFQEEQTLREFTTIKSVLQEMLQEDFSGCRKVMVQKLSSAEWNEVHWRL